MSQLYSSSQACKITGVTYRQLDHWIRIEVITPFQNPKGSGKERRFNFKDLIDLRTAKCLFDLGINSGIIKDLDSDLLHFPGIHIKIDTEAITDYVLKQVEELQC